VIKKLFLALLAPGIAIVFAFAVASLALLAAGTNPFEAYGLMWDFGTTSTSIASTVNRAIPLYISAVAVAIGFQMGLFNIGVEGQYLVAALFAGYVGGSISLWAPLHITVILLVAIVVGALWSGIAGILKTSRGVHEVISTIMLNFIGFSLIAFLFLRYFNADATALNLKTPPLPASALMPNLNWIFTSLGFSEPRGTDMEGFLVIAIAVGIFYYLLVDRTRFGFELRSSGMNAGAALMAGVNPKRMINVTMLISGGIAGLVGLSTMMGNLGAYTQDFPRQLGFTGIAVALLGRNHFVGMAFGALLFGFLDRSALILDLEDIPKEVVQIMQGVIVLAVVIAYEVVDRWIATREIRAAAEAAKQMDHKPEAVAA